MSSNIPSSLHYPLGERVPAPGQALTVAPGVRWLRLGLPFALDHINLWLLKDTEGWTLVDCGIDSPQSRDTWLQLEAQVLQGQPVRRIVVTHMHPDHVGLAHWLCERWQAPLWMNAEEYRTAAQAIEPEHHLGGPASIEFFRQHGWTPAQIEVLQRRPYEFNTMVPRLPALHQTLSEGQRLHTLGDDGQPAEWICLKGLGHSPEHMALHQARDRVLISGDMLLPSISTNISVWPSQPDADPLRGFLDALAAMQSLPDDTLVLPSHGRPFIGAALRIRQLQDHHAGRLQRLLEHCTLAPRTASEVLEVLFERELNDQQMSFATGEAIAHLNHLWLGGQLRREADAQGVWRFGATA